MNDFIASGATSGPVNHEEITPDVAMGGFAFSLNIGIYIPVDGDDDNLDEPDPIPDGEVIEL